MSLILKRISNASFVGIILKITSIIYAIWQTYTKLTL